MRYYIATSLNRFQVHNQVRDDLLKKGHLLTYDWTHHGSVQHTTIQRLQQVASLEYGAIVSADFVLVLLPGGRGTHTELGIAIAEKKPTFIHSEHPSLFQPGSEVCAFYHHPHVEVFTSPIGEVAIELERLLKKRNLTDNKVSLDQVFS